MATPTQRCVSIIDALLNSVSTTTQRNRVLDAYLQPMLILDPTATAGDAAKVMLKEVYDLILSRIEANETRAAIAATAAQVKTDFPITP